MSTATATKTRKTKPESTQFADCIKRLGLKPNAEQSAVAKSLDATSHEGKVGFIEAPTATGKTYAIAHHVLAHVSENPEIYVIAVPTIELGHQTLASIQKMQETTDAFKPVRATIILGRQEFLSSMGLDVLIEAFEEEKKLDAAEAIRAWIKKDAPGRSPNHPCYTRDGLEHWLDAQGIKEQISDAICLSPGELLTEGAFAYAKQFAANADILIVTHAMLARDLITRFLATSRERNKTNKKSTFGLSPAERWLQANEERLEVETGDEGRLPDYQRLIVDEAHLLRDNFENAMRTGISIASIIRHAEAIHKISPKSVSKAVIRQLKDVRRQLTNGKIANAGQRMQVEWSADDQCGDIIQSLHTALDHIKTSKIPPELDFDKVAIDRARYALRDSINARAAVSTVVEWSPVVAFPSITVGRKNISSQLLFFWTRKSLKSAALISATLYTETLRGPSIAFMASRLSVPQHMLKASGPIKANWLIKPVTVLMPKEGQAAYIPSDDPKARSAWLDNLAEHIITLSEGSKGTLILNTRRADSHELAKRIAKSVTAVRVIDGSNGRLSAIKQTFIKMSRGGLSPIWLAQGPAWTGLDLPDDVLDAMAITRLPFPTPAATKASDPGARSYGAEKISQMVITFKQGIGRLVRSRDAGPKTFVMFDGRIYSPSARGAQKHLSYYKQKQLPKSGDAKRA